MKVVPLGDKIVVKRLETDEKTPGGVFVPESAREKPQQGRVLSVGDGRLLGNGTRVPHQVKEGDRVVFSSWSGSEVTVNGDRLLLMSEADILAVMD